MADARFVTTSWSLVLTAAGGDTSRSRRALAELCEAYWYPLYCFIRRQGCDAQEAADLTQGYIAQLLEKEFLKGLSPEAGRFRSFLFASVKHFLSNERDRERALKRGGGQRTISLDAEVAEGRYRIEPADDLTPERLFERRWAMTVLSRVMERLRAEAVRAGGERRFDRLKGYLTGEERSVAQRDVAAELGMTESAVAVAIHRLRKRFGRLLRGEIAETVADPREIDDEVRYLLATLGGG
jgi:RNA polymerase sigma-70 factor (ECF subfamily)